jgi:hypothetical protein
MKNDVGRSSRSMKSRRPRLDGLEDRQLLSVVGALSRAQPHLLAVHTARLSASSTDPEVADGRSKGEGPETSVSNAATVSDRASVAAGPLLVDGSRSVSGSAGEVVSSEAPRRAPSRVLIAEAQERDVIREDEQGSIRGQGSTTPAAIVNDGELGPRVEASQSARAAGSSLREASDEQASPAIPADFASPRGDVGSDRTREGEAPPSVGAASGRGEFVDAGFAGALRVRGVSAPNMAGAYLDPGAVSAPRTKAVIDANVMTASSAGDPPAAAPRAGVEPGKDLAIGAVSAAPDAEPILSARGADLLASFSPFDRATLERTIDQFLDRLDDLAEGLSILGTWEALIPGLLTSAVAVSIAEAVLWQLDNAREGARTLADGGERAFAPGLPGLPRPWGLE